MNPDMGEWASWRCTQSEVARTASDDLANVAQWGALAVTCEGRRREAGGDKTALPDWQIRSAHEARVSPRTSGDHDRRPRRKRTFRATARRRSSRAGFAGMTVADGDANGT